MTHKWQGNFTFDSCENLISFNWHKNLHKFIHGYCQIVQTNAISSSIQSWQVDFLLRFESDKLHWYLEKSRKGHMLNWQLWLIKRYKNVKQKHPIIFWQETSVGLPETSYWKKLFCKCMVHWSWCRKWSMNWYQHFNPLDISIAQWWD